MYVNVPCIFQLNDSINPQLAIIMTSSLKSLNVKHFVQKNCLWPRYNLSNDVSNDLRGIQKHLHLNLYIKRTSFMMITQFFTGRGVSGSSGSTDPTLLQTVYYVTFSLDFCQAQGLLYNVVEGWFQDRCILHLLLQLNTS